MTDAKCPKCNAAMENIGGKLVCSECYHVLDGPSSSGSATRPAAPTAAAAPQAPVQLSKDPNAPLPIISQQPSAPLGTRPCPKCGGTCSDAGGRLVCDKCFWVIVDQVQPITQYSAPVSSASSMKQFGFAVAFLFIVVLVFVIRWNMSHNPTIPELNSPSNNNAPSLAPNTTPTTTPTYTPPTNPTPTNTTTGFPNTTGNPPH